MGDYWQALDVLVKTSEIKIDRPRGSRHPKFPNIVYPYDYGYLEGTTGGDGEGIDVWLGSLGDSVTGLVITVDLYKRDSEQKILVGCSDDEAKEICKFHNTNSQRATLLQRGTVK